MKAKKIYVNKVPLLFYNGIKIILNWGKTWKD